MIGDAPLAARPTAGGVTAATATHRQGGRSDLVDALSRHVRAAIADGVNDYVSEHATRRSIERQVDAFLAYRDLLPSGGRILDWGCFHAPEACLIRRTLGPAAELHACDVQREPAVRRRHDALGLRFRQLDDPVTLPYADAFFDAIVGAGVLEHVPRDDASIAELARVIRPGGVLAITFLPNRYSWTEWLARRRGLPHHRRRYTPGRICSMLTRHGFRIRRRRHHQIMPAQRGNAIAGLLWPLNAPLERAWPVRLLCANIMVVATRNGTEETR